ncbi:RICIN domain-containing protein [Streptomyces sp. NPDC019531]|uniref:RICIN domain-containing protein n=1 Tax=Streptomyces sp. NPDC019531 TaxID=3365062 RepID=UPI003850A233
MARARALRSCPHPPLEKDDAVQRSLRHLLPLWLIALVAGVAGRSTGSVRSAVPGQLPAAAGPSSRSAVADPQWRVRCEGSVVNVGPGKCLDAVEHGTANSAPLEIGTCTGGAHQIWRPS